jgi:hypothetical protein
MIDDIQQYYQQYCMFEGVIAGEDDRIPTF